MHVMMRGKKLNGEWILVKDRREEDSNKWLLIKAGTPLKLSAKADDTSVVSGRSMAQIAKDNDAQWQSNRPAEKRMKRGRSSHRIVKPAFVEPMHIKAVTDLPSGDDWTFEIKFDGYRCLAVKNGAKTTLFSRNGKRLNDRFGEVSNVVAELPGDFTIDGEIVALDEQGRPSFQLLQNSGSSRPPIFFYAFDLLNLEGEDHLDSPIERRRELLNELLGRPADPLRLSPLLQAPAGHVLEAVQKLGSKVWSESARDRFMNAASAAERGSRAASTVRRSLLSAASSRARMGWTR
jgi:bifunctional non-homologous end joining protein LigD